MSDSSAPRSADGRVVAIPERLAGLRLDQALAELFPDYSRSRLQSWVRSGCILLDGMRAAPRQRILGGERVALRPEAEPLVGDVAEDLPLTVVYADADLVVIDKPAGLVVHPAAGHSRGTLLNALLHAMPELAEIPRCGIVHRLDKDTSGLLMIARSLSAHKSLVDQLQARTARRQYLALVQGELIAGGTVDQPLGRHPVDRKRFAVNRSGKPSVTDYRIEERFPHHTLLRVHLRTGRTHQIRVHMAHLHHPLVGDPVYGRLRLPPGANERVTNALRGFRRQALHAERLGLQHPRSGELLEWSAPLPDDLQHLLGVLRNPE